MNNCGDQEDQKTLEKLRGERKEKIDELKEKTNYCLTQQLIQKYEVDPAAKAAAGNVLASKLGSESGFQFALQAADLVENEETGKSASKEGTGPDSPGLRNRSSVSRKTSQVERKPNFDQGS